MKIRQLFAASLLLLQFSELFAQANVTPNRVKPVASKPQSPSVPMQFGALAQDAGKNGVVTCGSRIDQHEKFFVQQKNDVGALLFVAPQDPNDQLVSMSLEIIENNEPAYISSNYSPTSKHGCAASYDLVKYWSESCKDLATRIYPQFGNPVVLKKRVVVLGTEPNVRIFLMPAGTGCVSIKKEMVY